MSSAPVSLTNTPFLSVNNMELPDGPSGEGPRAIPVPLDFTASASYQIDLSQIEQQAKMSMVQTVYVDLSGIDTQVTILVAGTGQLLTLKGRTNGYYPVLCPNPSKLFVTSIAGVLPPGTPPVPMFLVNVPILCQVWATQ